MLEHYYGDTVRAWFVAGAIIMAATLPFLSGDISEPLFVSIASILVVGVAAGLTSPRYLWTAVLNALIALFAFAVFTYYGVQWYLGFGVGEIFFWVNQILGIIFLVALYFAVKTVRGLYQRKSAGVDV